MKKWKWDLTTAGEKEQYAAEIEWTNNKVLIDVEKNKNDEFVMTITDKGE